jgi:hypothetical protein
VWVQGGDGPVLLAPGGELFVPASARR